ncbi:MAG: ABC transporter ATP-binding protein [Pseudomonadota bacterium]
MTALLEVDQLSISFETDQGELEAVKAISFSINSGETIGLVGESGCGKSVTALSVMRLLPQPMGRISGGNIYLEGRALQNLEYAEMEKLRGAEVSMIFQEPMTALNPVHTIGKQISEALLLHNRIDEREALKRSHEILERVGIPSPEIRLGEYPHQLSGGMRQRVVTAMALVCNPKLLIADEPTTALDVTIQAQILELISDLQQKMGMSVLLITHDLGIIAGHCDRVLVMYAGQVVESGSVFDIFDHPTHPYTQGLIKSIPRLEQTSKTRLDTIEGLVPSLDQMPGGCRFENRCPYSDTNCVSTNPDMQTVSSDHQVRCLHWERIAQNIGRGAAID